jgi:hypothetical protein
VIVASFPRVTQPARSGLVRALRRHWLFIALLLAGAALRVVVLAAYPALLASDSWAYLRMTGRLHPTRLHPAGYPALLKLLAAVTGDAPLRAVPVVQHALGLGVAGAIYALQLRLGVRRWLAALAVAPLLLTPTNCPASLSTATSTRSGSRASRRGT